MVQLQYTIQGSSLHSKSCVTVLVNFRPSSSLPEAPESVAVVPLFDSPFCRPKQPLNLCLIAQLDPLAWNSYAADIPLSVLVFRRKHPDFHQQVNCCLWGLHGRPLWSWGFFSHNSLFFEGLFFKSWKSVGFLSKAFSAPIAVIMWGVVFLILLIWCITLINFQRLN